MRESKSDCERERYSSLTRRKATQIFEAQYFNCFHYEKKNKKKMMNTL